MTTNTAARATIWVVVLVAVSPVLAGLVPAFAEFFAAISSLSALPHGTPVLQGVGVAALLTTAVTVEL